MRRTEESRGVPVCCVAGLTKRFGTAAGATTVTAVDDVTVEITRSTFTAIMGPSGSGKSTLLHCLAGLERPDGGTVTIDGIDLATLGDTQLSHFRRDRLGFVFQAYNLVPSLTARENILLPAMLGGRQPDAAWLDHLIDALGIRDRLDHFPRELSGGQQQRVAAARALAAKPAVVFADEPTGNLDTSARADLLQLLWNAVQQDGQTIVMVTHDPVAASYADRTLVLRDGRIVDTLPRMAAEAIATALAECSARA